MGRLVRLFVEIYNKETEAVIRRQAKGELVVRPSTILITLLAVFYFFSPFDLLPERSIKPLAFGFVDDMILVAIAVFSLYKDLGGGYYEKRSTTKTEYRKAFEENIKVHKEDDTQVRVDEVQHATLSGLIKRGEVFVSSEIRPVQDNINIVVPDNSNDDNTNAITELDVVSLDGISESDIDDLMRMDNTEEDGDKNILEDFFFGGRL